MPHTQTDPDTQQTELLNFAISISKNLLRYGLNYLHNVEDAEDALSTTLFRVWRYSYQFKPTRGEDGPRKWVCQIHRNICFDIMRKWKIHPETPIGLSCELDERDAHLDLNTLKRHLYQPA